MIAALLTLLVCQVAGEAAARALAVPVPGPVIGLALLFLALLAHGRLAPAATGEADADGVPAPLSAVCGFLLANLSLLFVPAGVGIVRHAPLVREYATAILAALIGSTVVTLAVTALVFSAVKSWTVGGAEETP